MRDKQFYVSTDVYRAFWMLAQRNKQSGLANPVSTPDEIADVVLRQYIEDNYPQLFAHQKQVDALEKQLIEQLTKPT